jgi:calmodulin
MRVIGEKLTDDEIEDAIKLADTSGDGEVDYDEFIQFVLSD